MSGGSSGRLRSGGCGRTGRTTGGGWRSCRRVRGRRGGGGVSPGQRRRPVGERRRCRATALPPRGRRPWPPAAATAAGAAGCCGRRLRGRGGVRRRRLCRRPPPTGHAGGVGRAGLLGRGRGDRPPRRGARPRHGAPAAGSFGRCHRGRRGCDGCCCHRRRHRGQRPGRRYCGRGATAAGLLRRLVANGAVPVGAPVAVAVTVSVDAAVAARLVPDTPAGRGAPALAGGGGGCRRRRRNRRGRVLVAPLLRAAHARCKCGRAAAAARPPGWPRRAGRWGGARRAWPRRPVWARGRWWRRCCGGRLRRESRG